MKPGVSNFYKRMLAAKKAKADKIKRTKKTMEEETPKVKGDNLSELPNQRIEVTKPIYSSKMDENTSPNAALSKAIERIREQAKGI